MITHRKFVIPIAVALVIAAFFTAMQPITSAMSIVSSLFVVLFALPSYFAVTRATGWKRGTAIVIALGMYGLLIESSAIHTGFPYGDFIYKDLLGQKVFGLTPWTVAFAWPPILLLAYWFARQRYDKSEKLKVLLTSAITAMSIDVVLDPAAVKLGFWEWRDPGFYYGVPLVNFLGWILSCFIGAVILHWLWRNAKVPDSLAYSGLLILWFWTWVNVFLLQILPVVVGFALLIIFFRKINRSSV